MGTEDAGRLLLATLAWVALSSHGLPRDTRTPHQRCPSSPNTSVKRTDALSPRDVLSSRPPRQRTSLSSSPSPSPSTREIGITALLPLSLLRVKLKQSIYILHLGTACRTDLGTACRTDLGTACRTDLGTDGGRLFITRYSVLLLHILRLVHLFFLFVLSHFNRLEAEMCRWERIATAAKIRERNCL